MKVTLMGLMNVPQELTAHLTLEEAISFKCLSEQENKLLQDNFVKLYYERPILVYDAQYFFKFLRTTCDTLESNVAMLKKSFSAEYNPLENYDRYEESNQMTSNTGKSSSHTASSNVNTDSGTADSFSTQTDKSDTANKISAFDTKVLATHDEQLSDNSSNITSGNSSKNEAYGKGESLGETSSTNDGHQKTVSHIHGNIGVTTATQMIGEIINLYEKQDFYDTVCKMIMQKSQCFYYTFN